MQGQLDPEEKQLLSNYEYLDDDRQARLKALLKVNLPLFAMHTMKEQLRLFWEKPDRTSADAFLTAWCRDAFNSGISPLIRLAKTLSSRKTALLNYFDHLITCANLLERINNKIETLKRQAYGFRDMEYFIIVRLTSPKHLVLL